MPQFEFQEALERAKEAVVNSNNYSMSNGNHLTQSYVA